MALPAQRSQITGFNGEKSTVLGMCELTVSVPGKDFVVVFLVVDAPCACILGIDFIDGQDVQFDRDLNYVWYHRGVVGGGSSRSADDTCEIGVLSQGQVSRLGSGGNGSGGGSRVSGPPGSCGV
jgi:hypothetical protein